jgi:hypothetical protein
MRRTAIVSVVLLVLMLAGGSFSTASNRRDVRQAAPIGYVAINGRTYGYGDALFALGRFAPWGVVRTIVNIARTCQGIRTVGFVSSQGAGIVAWVPNSFAGCVSVAGGGGVSGGGPVSGPPCLQVFRTPANRDPNRLSTDTNTLRYHVLIAGTSLDACADISTQVPGGFYARNLATDTAGLAQHETVLVKCQYLYNRRLVDVVVRPALARFPAARTSWRIYDSAVFTGTDEALVGVPSCVGVSIGIFG